MASSPLSVTHAEALMRELDRREVVAGMGADNVDAVLEALRAVPEAARQELARFILGDAVDSSTLPQGGRHLTVDQLYAWVATEAHGGEGVVGGHIPGVFDGPFVGADRDMVIRLMRPIALDLRRVSGCPVRLVRYSLRTTLEELP